MDELDIHNRKANLETMIATINKTDKLRSQHKKDIMRFRDECVTQGLSPDRVLFYLEKLKLIGQQFNNKNFKDMTKDDIKRIVAWNESRNLAEWTKHGYKITIKKFWQFLHSIDWHSGQYPECVSWLKLTMTSNKQKLPSDILNADEIKALINAASHPRDKCFLSMTYESGCRIGEIGNIKMRDISFNEYGFKINVTGKTGARVVLLIFSTPYLKQWLEVHPNKNDPNACLWCSLGRPYHNGLSWRSFVNILRDAQIKAGIKKRCHLHLLRHSRATHLCTHLSDCTMKEVFGWAKSSKMVGVYTHISGKQTDNEILKVNGIIVNEKDDMIRPLMCPRCSVENLVTADFCIKCHYPLNEKALKEVISSASAPATPDMIKAMIRAEVARALAEKVQEINIKKNDESVKI